MIDNEAREIVMNTHDDNKNSSFSEDHVIPQSAASSTNSANAINHAHVQAIRRGKWRKVASQRINPQSAAPNNTHVSTHLSTTNSPSMHTSDAHTSDAHTSETQVLNAHTSSIISHTVNSNESHPDDTSSTDVQLGDSRDLFKPRSQDIPALPGVYKWRDEDGTVIYVGKAKNLRNRLKNYFQPLYQLDPKTQAMVLTARSLEWTVVGSELEALTLEYMWIKEFDPRFNIVFRDDKTYPYLAVSFGEEIPRIWITRNKKTKKTKYFGPYVKVRELRHALDKLLWSFPVRTCTPAILQKAMKTGRPCLLASIGKCSAPCVGNISLSEHREMMLEITALLTGRIGSKYIKTLKNQMYQASEDLDFEKAAALRDLISSMESIVQENAVVFQENVDADIYGLAADELEASVHVFHVRAGTIRGERNWSIEKVDGISNEQLLSNLLVQVYSELMEDAKKESAIVIPKEDNHTSIKVSTHRSAIAPSQSLQARSPQDRVKSTRYRHLREAFTGRTDLFSESSPIPSQILVPFLPEDSQELEEWLKSLRGSSVRIRVPKQGDKLALILRATQNAELALNQIKTKRGLSLASRQEAMLDLKQQLRLPSTPLRIEGYDISNAAGGGQQVASMVVFEDGMSKRSDYRRFVIKGDGREGPLDDLSAVKEVIERRFRHGLFGEKDEDGVDKDRVNEEENINKDIDKKESEEKKEKKEKKEKRVISKNTSTRKFAYKPNLIVIDGGKYQVRAAVEILEKYGIEDVTVCGLSKRLEEVWLAHSEYPLILKRQSEGMYLLQRLRDESHRFAIEHHRLRRRKATLESVFDTIPGIGETYSKRILKAFGSVKKLMHASQEEIARVKGIGKTRATTIYRELHKADTAPSTSTNGDKGDISEENVNREEK